MTTSGSPSRRAARIRPSVFFRGSIRPTERTNGNVPNRPLKQLRRRRADRRQHSVGHDADPLRAHAEETHELIRLAPRVGQDQRRPACSSSAASSASAGTTDRSPQPARLGDLADRVGLERRHRARLVPADRRENDRDPPRPGHPRQLEPLARHPEEMKQPRLFEPVGPRARRAGPEPPALPGAGRSGPAGSRPRPAPERRTTARAGSRPRRAPAPAVRLQPLERRSRLLRASSRPGMCHAQAPARLSFHHLSPRLTRLGIDDRGISSSGVTVSQSIAALHRALERKRLARRSPADPGRARAARAARRPARAEPERHPRARHRHRTWNGPR